MRTEFDEQLTLLDHRLAEMGVLCEKAIDAAMGVLAGRPEAAEQTDLYERETDRAEREIETLCLRLLLRQQPVARDLRLISSALKMISDLERIGDQASDIAEIAVHLQDGRDEDAAHLRRMALAASRMVTESVDAFVQKDLALAQRVQADDDAVDALFIAVRAELAERLRTHPERAMECLDLLMVAKYLERIGDHAVNVAEWVEYSITGMHTEKV